MKYNLKKGDKVRIKPGVNLIELGISSNNAKRVMKADDLTITEDTPGEEGWKITKIDQTPTYSVSETNRGWKGWRIPESYLIKKG